MDKNKSFLSCDDIWRIVSKQGQVQKNKKYYVLLKTDKVLINFIKEFGKKQELFIVWWKVKREFKLGKFFPLGGGWEFCILREVCKVWDRSNYWSDFLWCGFSN